MEGTKTRSHDKAYVLVEARKLLFPRKSKKLRKTDKKTNENNKVKCERLNMLFEFKLYSILYCEMLFLDGKTIDELNRIIEEIQIVTFLKKTADF